MPNPEAKKEEKVVLYTSLAGTDTKPFKESFEKKIPGINLDIYRTSGSKILQKVLAEHNAGADIAASSGMRHGGRASSERGASAGGVCHL